MYQHTDCPLCANKAITEFLTTRDHTTTGEMFHIYRCTNCQFAFTNPRPDTHLLGLYYQSTKYLSHNNSQNTLISRIYQLARNYTTNWKASIIKEVHANPVLLDYGCGTGNFLQTCLTKGWNVSGIEPSTEARTIAIQNTGLNIYPSLHSIDNRTYDIITLWHVLEHVEDLHKTLDNLVQKLNPKGTLIIAVPNSQSPDAIHYRQNWAAWDTPRHLWHFSTKTITLLMQNHTLKILKIIPMMLDSFYISLLSEQYQDQTQNKFLQYTKAIYQGLRSNIIAHKTRNHSSLIYVIQK